MKSGRNSRLGFEGLNPFTQMVERMTGLARHWGNGVAVEGNENAVAGFTQALDEARSILSGTAERQFEIAAKAQKHVIERMIALADARSPQDVWACQTEIMTALAEAGEKHSTVWAACCRSMREQCSPSTLRESHRHSPKPSAPEGNRDNPTSRPKAHGTRTPPAAAH